MQDIHTPSDNDLIIEARKGNDAAFTALVHRYDRKVLGTIANYFNSSDDAKDVYQDVFIRVYKGLQKFEFRSEFSTWLFRVTTNVCLTHKARSKNFELKRIYPEDDDGAQAPVAAEEHGPDRQFATSELRGRMDAAIESLPPKQKMVFVLKHSNEFKIREIAEIMNCTEGTVKKYLFLAVNSLRLKLKGITE